MTKWNTSCKMVWKDNKTKLFFPYWWTIYAKWKSCNGFSISILLS